MNINNKFKSKSLKITDSDKLRTGDCVCVIKNKYNGAIRYAKGSVVPVPYSKQATAEVRKKYGKNLVYVCYHDSENIVGYYQNNMSKIKNKGKN